jgi:N-acetylglucosamine-6-sulfatase
MPEWTRRDVLKILGVGTLSLPLFQVPGCARRSTAGRPNIVFILTDDHRYDALGCAGHPWLQTPQLDRLAREGVRFENAFVTTSLCSPSRGSFLTGCYAHTHGVTANEVNDPVSSLPVFPRLLQEAGYETAFIGKWHMARWSTPRRGFDHWVSFNGQGEYLRNTLNVDGRWELTYRYITDELTDYALRFLRRERQRPFCLYLSHKAIHAPFIPAPRHARLYEDVIVTSRDDPRDRLDEKPDWGNRRKEFPDWNLYLRNYLRCLMAVDESLGRIMQELAEQQILDETVIVYAGDNGFLHGEHGGLWDKRLAYEPSIRIPLLLRYPPLVRASQLCPEIVLNIDLAPTLLQLAGCVIPANMQGQSWRDVLTGAPGREAFLYEYFAESPAEPSILAVRTRRWKYVTYTRPTGIPPERLRMMDELYDLERDPQELDNLISDRGQAAVLADLQQQLQRLREQTGYRSPAG